ncbi:MAG: phosphoglycerate dehydrogenase [Anaerolineae bacterium]|nr:phosphoglycerate dehydrogenase [Anaerolineae bacterium]
MPEVFVTPPMLADLPGVFQPLRDAGIDVTINAGAYPLSVAELSARIGDAEAVILGLDEVTDALFRARPNLRILARNGVGMDTVDVDAATRAGVLVTVPYGANSTSVAELTFGLMIALLRRIVSNHNRVQTGEWRREPGVELAGKTLGIIGLGRIGRKVARRALGFEMRVIAHDIAPDEAFVQANGIPLVSRETLLETSDIVSLHVPLTDLTRHMIDAAALARMAQGAFLINAARGAVVDTHALADSLDRGHLAGAALDVHPVEGRVERTAEPPAMITTTHLGAYTHEALAATARSAVCYNLRAAPFR